MLSGQRAFRGETAMDTMTAILKEDPPDLPVSKRHVPPALERIVDRCLEKSPTSRFKSADDLAFALKGLSSQPEVSVPTAAASTGRSRGWTAWIVAGLAMLLVGLLSIPVVIHLREAPPTRAPETRLEIITPATADPVSFAISPDGRRLVFVASGDGQPRLWLRPLDATTAQPLAGTEGAGYPFWSPDSQSVGFFDGSKLKRVDPGGGLPQTLADAAPRGGSWNPDGIILFTRSATSPLFSVPASGGEAVAVTKLDAPMHQLSHRFPHFLPGGRQFLFFVQGTTESDGIYLGSLDAPETKRLTAADAAGAYTPPGWLLFVRQGSLVARHLDPSRAELTGDPRLAQVIANVGLTKNTRPSPRW
jgi:eukaryotic-like serine/threonine-protein kinase